MLSMIVAMDKHRVIGVKNTIPWRLSADLQYFKSITMGKPIIMGRKTYDSIGRPLPGRRNIILSRQTDLAIEGCETFDSPEAVNQELVDSDEVMIIGGEQIYKLFMPFASKLYVTEVDTEVAEGDAYFSMFDPVEWRETSREYFSKDEKNECNYCFVVYERVAC
ncbi:MAG: Dihydrofolate reductase (EC [uncultured Thiotrichaceae bacterium]|uniref:Dihydrofolate reductase n=1 Tax=uncultured Thiotrichaceae bacterium TaxID=298394 RepID=A0A6S6SNF1_9GAMM|nr:MAG: Dihydrofolate reductase (EC [uncultured Thiotrichaceae bacterium]